MMLVGWALTVVVRFVSPSEDTEGITNFIFDERATIEECVHDMNQSKPAVLSLMSGIREQYESVSGWIECQPIYQKDKQ